MIKNVNGKIDKEKPSYRHPWLDCDIEIEKFNNNINNFQI